MILVALNLSHLSDFVNAGTKKAKSLFEKKPQAPPLGNPEGAVRASMQGRRSGGASTSVDAIPDCETETVLMHSMPKAKARSLDLENGRSLQ